MRHKILLPLLVVASILALCLPCRGRAAQEEREPAAWIEWAHPDNALDAATSQIVVRRLDENIKFTSPVHMAPLYPGDTIKINDAGACLYLLTSTGRMRVDGKKAADSGGEYRIEVNSSTVWGNFAAWFHKLSGFQIVQAVTTRGGSGTPAIPTILEGLDENFMFKLVAGKRDLRIRWTGGQAPFRVLVLNADDKRGEAPLDIVDSKEKRVALRNLNLTPGIYHLVIKDTRGLGVENPRGLATLEKLEVVQDVLPDMPTDLAEAPLPDEARQLLYARWLAEDRAWTLEAMQIASALADSYPPAAEWLKQWE